MRSAVVISVLAWCTGGAAAQELLLVPLDGVGPEALEDAPALLTEAVRAGAGDKVQLAAAPRADLIALVGCAEETSECWAEVAATVEATQLLYGSVLVGTGQVVVVVELTLVAGGGQRSTRFDLHGTSYEELGTELTPLVREFLASPPPAVPAVAPEPEALAPAPAAAVQRAVEPEPRFAYGRVRGYSWAIGGTGVAMVGTGAILLIMATGSQAEVDTAPTGSAAELTHLADLEQRGQSLTAWGNRLLLTGLVAAAAGGALVYYQGRTRSRIEVTPTVTQGGAAVTLRWSWP